MAVEWVPQTLAGIIVWPVAWALALFVLFARPDRSQNRWLAVVLALEGVMMGAGGGWVHAADTFALSWALQAMTIVAVLAIVPAYLLFLSTLEAPLVRFLRWPPLAWTLRFAVVAAPILWFASDASFMTADDTGGLRLFSGDGYAAYSMPAMDLAAMLVVLVSILGLAASIQQFRRADPGVPKDQARGYLRAFAWRDIGYLIIFPATFLAGDDAVLYTGVLAPSLMVLVFHPLLAYAILKHQILGVDVKVKLALRGSALAAPFAIVFFVLGETLEGLLPFDSYWLGLAAAGALALAFVPLQRAATGLADRLMPGVADTKSHRDRRAKEIYDAAMAARADGSLTTKEQRVLRDLARQLGITDTSAAGSRWG